MSLISIKRSTLPTIYKRPGSAPPGHTPCTETSSKERAKSVQPVYGSDEDLAPPQA